MSADNRIVVKILGDNWVTYMEQGDEPYSDGEIRGNYYYKKFGDDKLKAVEYATEICRDEIVEYGVDLRD